MNNPTSGYLLFQAGARDYALSLAALHEIADLLPITPLPGAPSFLLGATNFHGKIAAVVDLAAFVENTPPAAARSNLLLLSLPGASLALAISRLGLIVHPEDIHATEPASAPYAEAELIMTAERVTLIAPDRLLTAIETALAESVE